MSTLKKFLYPLLTNLIKNWGRGCLISTPYIKVIITLASEYICYTYTTGSSALLDIYAQAWGRVRTYQTKHECLWYKCYIPHCPCGLIACQYKLVNWIYYKDSLRKFDYGPAHASSNHRYAYVVNKNGWILWKSWKVLISIKQLFCDYCIISQSLLGIWKINLLSIQIWVWSLIKNGAKCFYIA